VSSAEKVALAIVPDRQTVPVLGAIQRLFTGSLGTAIRG